MAIFRQGPMIGAISGTVGGSVFALGNPSPIIRARSYRKGMKAHPKNQARADRTTYIHRWLEGFDDERLEIEHRRLEGQIIKNRLGEPRQKTLRDALAQTIYSWPTTQKNLPQWFPAPPIPATVPDDWTATRQFPAPEPDISYSAASINFTLTGFTGLSWDFDNWRLYAAPLFSTPPVTTPRAWFLIAQSPGNTEIVSIPSTYFLELNASTQPGSLVRFAFQVMHANRPPSTWYYQDVART